MKSESYSFKQNTAECYFKSDILHQWFYSSCAVVPLRLKIIGKGNIYVAPRMHLILLAIKSHTLPPTKNYLLSFEIHTYLDSAAHLSYCQRKTCVENL